MNKRVPVRFRVTFHGWIVTVFIWSTVARLRAAYKANGGKRPDDVLSCCHTYTRHTAKGHKTRDIAQVHLVVDHLTTGIVSHEFTHAAVGLLRRRGWLTKLDKTDDESQAGFYEEYLCEAQAEWLRQAVNRFYDLGLLQ